MALLATLAALVAVLAACSGSDLGSDGNSTREAGPVVTVTPTATPPPAPVNLSGAWTATIVNGTISPPSQGSFTLRITQTGNAITCTASANVPPLIGSDQGCTAVANNLVPTNNHIDVRFTIHFPVYQTYDQITVSYVADYITTDGLHMSGQFNVSWERAYGYGGAGSLDETAVLLRGS
jgi:hypothetical protein